MWSQCLLLGALITIWLEVRVLPGTAFGHTSPVSNRHRKQGIPRIPFDAPPWSVEDIEVAQKVPVHSGTVSHTLCN
jgi:hypothetical protein